MSPFSSIEQSVVQLLSNATPDGVKVTTLPVQQAASSKLKGRRINVAFLRVAVDSTGRNMPTPATGRAEVKTTPPLWLDFLVSVHAADYAATDSGPVALLETAFRAVQAQPVLVLPVSDSSPLKKPVQATMTVVDFSVSEWAQLWAALQAPWQPALLIRIHAEGA